MKTTKIATLVCCAILTCACPAFAKGSGALEIIVEMGGEALSALLTLGGSE